MASEDGKIVELPEETHTYEDLPNLLQTTGENPRAQTDNNLPRLEDLSDEANVKSLLSNINDFDVEQLKRIYELVIKSLEIPSLDWVWWTDDYTTAKPEYIIQEQFKEKTKRILPLLKALIGLNVADDNAFLVLSSFTLKSPWADDQISQIAENMISSLTINRDNLDQLSRMIYEDFKIISSTEKVTKAGYKKAYKSLTFRSGITLQHQTSRMEWRESNIRSISCLYTLISNLDTKDIKDFWWIIAPSILNILDDHEGPVKLAGVLILSKLLDNIDSKFLKNTGMSKLFKDSMMPLLSYLPSITPLKQSIAILTETYPTLIKLFKSNDDAELYEKELIELLNSGIFFSLNSVRDNRELLVILVEQITTIIGELGVKTLKVLPRLIYNLGTIISNPFIDLDPELFEKSLDCLIELELNCWPTLGNHKFDILGMIIISYQRERKTTGTTSKIAVCIELLEHIVGRDTLLSDYEELVRVHGELKSLFRME